MHNCITDNWVATQRHWQVEVEAIATELLISGKCQNPAQAMLTAEGEVQRARQKREANRRAPEYTAEGAVATLPADGRAAGQAAPTVIQLTPAEMQSGLDRVRWAEGLIRQLPANHDGRNSWLLNYGTKA